MWGHKDLPDIKYDLIKPKSVFSGEDGRKRLIYFLASLEKCQESKSLFSLIRKYFNKNPDTEFANALAYVLNQSMLSVPAEQRLTTEQDSAELEKFGEEVSKYIKKHEETSAINATLFLF
jgi:hypothetical protein